MVKAGSVRCLALLVVLPGISLAAPDGPGLPTQPPLVTPGASRAAAPTAEEALRRRARDFNEALFKGEYALAVTFVDPDIREVVDSKALQENFRGLMAAIQGINAAVGRKFNKLHVHKVTIEKDKPKATVIMFLASSDKSGGGVSNNALPPQEWVLKKSLWYWTK